MKRLHLSLILALGPAMSLFSSNAGAQRATMAIDEQAKEKAAEQQNQDFAGIFESTKNGGGASDGYKVIRNSLYRKAPNGSLTFVWSQPIKAVPGRAQSNVTPP